MKIEVVQQYDIEIPEPPKHFKATGGKRASISTSDFTPAALREIGLEWLKALMLAAGHQASDAYTPTLPNPSDT